MFVRMARSLLLDNGCFVLLIASGSLCLELPCRTRVWKQPGRVWDEVVVELGIMVVGRQEYRTIPQLDATFLLEFFERVRD